MASRLQQLITTPETSAIPAIPKVGGGSRLGTLLEGKKEAGITEIPEIPKAVQTFPSTIEMLAELQIDPLSLKADPKKILSATWESLKTTVSESAPKITSQFSTERTFGERLKGIAAAGHLVFSPITALFEGAEQIPVLGSVSRLIGTAFVAVGEGASNIAGKIVDELPIPVEQIDLKTGKRTHPKQDIKEGIQEITALAAQLALGKATHIGSKKFNELKTRFGEKDAQTIVDKATELAERAKEPVPKEIAGKEPTPIDIRFIDPRTKMGDIAREAKERGFEVPEFGLETPEPKPKFIEVPREQLPIKTEGAEKGISALEARMKGVLETKDVEIAKREAESRGVDISIFDRMSKPEQLRAAAKYAERTSQREILEVLEGKREAPKGLLHNAIMLALEEKSLRDRNVDLAIKLASLRSTRAGQEISILTEVSGLSPVSGLHEIIRARREATTKRLKEGETIGSKKSSSVADIKTEQTKLQLKMSEAEKLLESITC